MMVVLKFHLTVNDIKRGIPPTIKWLSLESIDGKEISVPIRVGENEKDIIEKVTKMTYDEYNKYYKDVQRELYSKKDKENRDKKEELSKKIDSLFKENEIDLTDQVANYQKYGFTLKGLIDGYEFLVEFKYDSDISDKLRDLLKSFDIDGYKGELVRVMDGYKTDSSKYYLLEFKK